MATINQFPICIRGDEIQFGRHILPIECTEVFWVYAFEQKEPLVQIHLETEERSTTYQMRTKNETNTAQLVQELFNHTKAQLSLGVTAIQPSEKGVSFTLFSVGEAEDFKRYIVPHFFSESEFDVSNTLTERVHIVLKKLGNDRDKVRSALEKLSDKVNDFAIERLLSEHGDPKFQIPHHPFDSMQSTIRRSNNSFVIDPDEIRHIRFAEDFKRKEDPIETMIVYTRST